MNYDSFYDSLKSIGKLVYVKGDDQFTILIPFVNENRKVSMLVETEAVFFEDTHLEFESKKVFTTYEPAVEITDSSDCKKLFGSVFSQNENKLNISKIGCPNVSFDGDKNDIISLVDTAVSKHKKALEDILVRTSGHLNLSFGETCEYLKNGVTIFGYLEGIQKAFKDVDPSQNDLIENMCAKSELKTYFNKYLESCEEMFSAISVYNLVNN
jgi:hypothetical protein